MVGRRGNGEGTITRRKDGRWEARYYVQTANGVKRKVLYGKTRAEVSDKLVKAQSDRIDGIAYDDENMTLGEYIEAWLKGSVFGSVRQSTYDRDTNLVNNHIKPILGGVKLKKLNAAQVQSFYRNRLDAGLSSSTVHKMHDILRRGLTQAVGWHLVPRNVADTVKPPRPAPKEMQALSNAEARRLLEAAGEDRLEALYILAIHTGMRQGELLALRWQDVDLENAVASVRRTLTRSGGKVVFGEPKTKKSRRSIRLTSQAVEALRSHLERQLQDMEILGDRYQDQGLVFTTDTGAPINPSNLRQRSLTPLLKRAGLPHMRFHDLRHTCATLLLSRGVHPKFVQELLGHATIAITLDTYSHVMPSMGDATAKAMEDALA
ncbi:MAG: site-specific integrase [Actinobacteria bacterium]|nr:MAG: site-specific integrase [Actinomycetota bacterium]